MQAATWRAFVIAVIHVLDAVAFTAATAPTLGAHCSQLKNDGPLSSTANRAGRRAAPPTRPASARCCSRGLSSASHDAPRCSESSAAAPASFCAHPVAAGARSTQSALLAPPADRRRSPGRGSVGGGGSGHAPASKLSSAGRAISWRRVQLAPTANVWTGAAWPVTAASESAPNLNGAKSGR